jgi:anion transporter
MKADQKDIEKNGLENEVAYDPLDMSNYHLNKLPKRERSKVEKFLVIIGAPLAVLVFILINYFAKVPFLHNIDPTTLSEKARAVYEAIGPEAFSATNISMLAIFLAAVILWITEAIPNYLTSLILIIGLVLTNVLSEVDAYHQLGHKVMWLNILSFVLASMLVKTGVAKRFALWFIIKFGKNASSIFISFIVINIILSAFISATTAKAAILLPIFMVVSAVYGATGGKDKNNFGRNIVLQNLLQINMGAGMFVTGSGANLLAAALIGGAIGSDIFFTDWMTVAFPISLAIMIIGFFVGTKFIFPMKPEDKKPQISGGMMRLKRELVKMGPVGFEEIRSVVIFVTVLALWTTDKYHGISPTAVAFLGAVVALLPRIGVVNWNEVDIPWHLLLFSAGAYTLGAGFKVTDLPSLSVNAIFDGLGFNDNTPFGILYLILTGTMLASALIFQSKTMRTLIFVPIAIGVAQKFGYPVLSLAFPVALLIEHVYVLPFNSKPALLLYSTDQYSWSDTFKYGITMMGITWVLFMILGETWLRFLGYTPNGIFGLF